MSLEAVVEVAVEDLRQFAMAVANYNGDQLALIKRLHGAVDNLQAIAQAQQQTPDVDIPFELIQFVDQGRNPELYTRERLASVAHQMQMEQGKADTFEAFQKQLAAHLEQAQIPLASAPHNNEWN